VLKDFQQKFLGFEPQSRGELRNLQIVQELNAARTRSRSPVAGDDPALATSKAYGMHADDVQAWGNMFKGNTWKYRDQDEHRDWYPKAAKQAAQNKPVGEVRMNADSFHALALGATQRGPEDRNIATGPSHRPGDVLDGYEVLPEPSSDKENNVGIPDIVRDVFAGTTRPQPQQQAGSADDQPEQQVDPSSDEDSDSGDFMQEDPMYGNPFLALHEQLAGEQPDPRA